jgi:MYXO-CTERM domain-containing protein
MSSTKALLGPLVSALILAAAGTASAQTCAKDSDCPQGLACHSTTVTNPSGPDCPPNTDCPKPPDAPPSGTVVMSCEPKSCSTDADCGGGDMVCHSQTSTACSGGAVAPRPSCPPNTKCDAGPPVKTEDNCTTTTVKQCAFKWQLPCNVHADCGVGFLCKPTEIGTCTGSAGSGTSGSSGSGGAAGGGSAGAPRPAADPVAPPPSDAGAPMCTTTTSYPGYCQPTVTSCVADSDCPANWKCLDQASDTPVSGGPAPGTGAGFAPPRNEDAGTTALAKTCQSAFAQPARDSKGETTSGGSGASGGSTGNGNGSGGTPPPATPGPGTPTGSMAKGGGGCSIDAGATSSGASLVLMMAVGLLIARRRRVR